MCQFEVLSCFFILLTWVARFMSIGTGTNTIKDSPAVDSHPPVSWVDNHEMNHSKRRVPGLASSSSLWLLKMKYL
ncbi:hypothetical protein GGR54DRAFT_606147 [Hypoxylon sp. NC1633]|nr:hypothetical protein GGR54DRAFT_606147 [Hypoxylon sp. NC1633]